MILVTTSMFWLSWAILERLSSVLLCKATQHLISCFTAKLTACCLLSITMELLSFILIISLKVITGFSGTLAFGSLQVIILPAQRRMQTCTNLACKTESPWQHKWPRADRGPDHPLDSAEGLHRNYAGQRVSVAFTSNKQVPA